VLSHVHAARRWRRLAHRDNGRQRPRVSDDGARHEHAVQEGDGSRRVEPAPVRHHAAARRARTRAAGAFRLSAFALLLRSTTMKNMTLRRTIGLSAVAVFALTGAAVAHHSFSATYDESEEAKIEGEVAQFLFRNPHTMVQVLAPDETGAV